MQLHPLKRNESTEGKIPMSLPMSMWRIWWENLPKSGDLIMQTPRPTIEETAAWVLVSKNIAQIHTSIWMLMIMENKAH